MGKKIKELKRESRKANSLPDKIQLQKQANDMESKRDKEWKEYDTAKKEIETKKDQLIDEIQSRLEQNIKEDIVFKIEWEVV